MTEHSILRQLESENALLEAENRRLRERLGVVERRLRNITEAIHQAARKGRA